MVFAIGVRPVVCHRPGICIKQLTNAQRKHRAMPFCKTQWVMAKLDHNCGFSGYFFFGLTSPFGGCCRGFGVFILLVLLLLLFVVFSFFAHAAAFPVFHSVYSFFLLSFDDFFPFQTTFNFCAFACPPRVMDIVVDKHGHSTDHVINEKNL